MGSNPGIPSVTRYSLLVDDLGDDLRAPIRGLSVFQGVNRQNPLGYTRDLIPDTLYAM